MKTIHEMIESVSKDEGDEFIKYLDTLSVTEIKAIALRAVFILEAQKQQRLT